MNTCKLCGLLYDTKAELDHHVANDHGEWCCKGTPDGRHEWHCRYHEDNWEPMSAPPQKAD